MAYCLDPDCSRPHNPDNNQYCHGCGKNLNDTSQSYDFRYRFRLVKLLGQGGFGRTYKAQDLDFYQRACVIKKLIFQAQGEALNKVKELFAREAQQLLTLTHPQIPDLYAYFEHNNSLYLVQEYV
jgi:serine/threonine protein kinase